MTDAVRHPPSPSPIATTGSRIGLLGGSFDPPHLAHLTLARSAYAVLALDHLRWLPAGQPWQKADRRLASATHRTALLRLLLAGDPRFVLDERELRRAGPSYSIDTVAELADEHPGATLFLVIGQDQYVRFDTWHRWPDLLTLCTLAVASRDGHEPIATPALAAVPHRMVSLPMPRMDISATDIRHRAGYGLPIAPLVGEAVAGYIGRHALYHR